MQDISLPAAFATQTLTSIQLVDNGGPSFQRTILDGVTVESVPEPSRSPSSASGRLVYWPSLGGEGYMQHRMRHHRRPVGNGPVSASVERVLYASAAAIELPAARDRPVLLRLGAKLAKLLGQAIRAIAFGFGTLAFGFGEVTFGVGAFSTVRYRDPLAVDPSQPSGVEVFIAAFPQPQAQAYIFQPEDGLQHLMER